MTDKKRYKNYSDQDLAMLEEVKTWLQQEPERTKAMISSLTGMPSGTVNSILSGGYQASPTKKLLQILDVLERQAIRDQDGRSELPICETSVHRQITALLKRAHRDRDIGLFAGSPGIGKTSALAMYALQTKNVAMVGASRGIGHATFMHMLAEQANVEVRRSARADEVALEIIKAYAGTDGMILADEANYLSDQSLDALRRISDQAGIALMLVGLPELIARIQGIEGRLGQLASRISFWPPVVRQISRDDCAALVTAYFEPDDMDVGDELVDAYWTCCGGSARLLRNLCRNTYRAATNSDAAVTAKLVERVNEETMAGSNAFRRAQP